MSVHDHVPEQNTTSYLRDIAWNVTSEWPTGIHACFRATESIGLILFIISSCHMVSHRYRSIILRRFFFHIGTVYMYRIFTISFTILPVPKLPLNNCAPKTDGQLW